MHRVTSQSERKQKRDMADVKKKCRHKNHRNRLRDAYRTGIMPQLDVKYLEIVLFYTIPRYDTSGMAQDLLEKFGSLPGVFTAKKEDLMQVQGIGSKAADYIILCGAMLNEMFISLYFESCIDCHATAGSYALWSLSSSLENTISVMYLGSENAVVGTDKAEGDETEIKDLTSRLETKIKEYNADKIIVSRKHEDGKLKANDSDIQITNALNSLCKKLKLSGFEYYIVNDKSYMPLCSKVINDASPIFEV